MAKNSERNIFEELVEGADALRAAREGKITLRTTEVTIKPEPELPDKPAAIEQVVYGGFRADWIP